jgi:hypothetical protein
MFEREITLYAFNLAHLKALAADLPEEQLDLQPAPGLKPARWVLGHLAVATDLAARCLGLESACPAEWHTAFGPGSQPGAPGVRPTKEELLAALEAGHARVSEAARTADPERMNQRHKVAVLRPTPLRTARGLGFRSRSASLSLRTWESIPGRLSGCWDSPRCSLQPPATSTPGPANHRRRAKSC